MRNRILQSGVFLLLASVGFAQGVPLDKRSNMPVRLPEDSPVAVIAGDWGDTTVTPSGGAVLLDFHTSLVLRNVSNKVIRGITLEVIAHEVTPGGKASVTVPSLNVPPRTNFPVRIDLRLLRPPQTGTEPMVEMSVDGVLFSDLSFVGPNTLNSRRSMLVWELEAQRDRKYFRSVLDNAGQGGLQDEMVASLSRQVDRSRMDAQVSRTNHYSRVQDEHDVQLAFLNLADSPVEPVQGMTRVAGNEARTPQLSMFNRSDRAVRFVELGWIVRDAHGQEYYAGSMPVNVALGPRQTSAIGQQPSLRFSQRSGQGIAVEGLTTFVDSVEFNDGTVWVPNRNSLSDPRVRKAVAPSPEEQRLAEMYRKKGIAALADELRKF